MSLGFAGVWMMVDIFFLQSNHPFPIGVWHGITSSLMIALTAVWGLAEMTALRATFEKKNYTFKMYRLLAWLTFMYVSFIEALVMTLLLFFRNHDLPDGFVTDNEVQPQYTKTQMII